MTSAIDKRDRSEPPQIEILEVARGPGPPAGKMLVSSPLELDALIRRIPPGKVLRMSELRENLARNHGADYACPHSIGIFLRIVAEATEEERAIGVAQLAPYWRLVGDEGEMLDRFPGGALAQSRRLAAEGVPVFHLGKRMVVADLEGMAWIPPTYGTSLHRKGGVAVSVKAPSKRTSKSKKAT